MQRETNISSAYSAEIQILQAMLALVDKFNFDYNKTYFK